MLDKSTTFTNVDTLIYDLEDAVRPDPESKAKALSNLREFLLSSASPNGESGPEIAVRINNPLDVPNKTTLDEIELVSSIGKVSAIVVPKVSNDKHLRIISSTLRRGSRGAPSVLALIESGAGILNLSNICWNARTLSGMTFDGLIFAAEDYCHDTGITRTPELRELDYARSHIVNVAAAFRIPHVIDMVCTNFRGEEGLRVLETECLDGKRRGFTGKQVIHPSQVETAQRIFSPTPEELEWAVRLLSAEKVAITQNRGSWSLSGKMIDLPVIKKAKAIRERAQICRIDCSDLEDKWRHQGPDE